jgi:hypothetical protein
MGCVGPLSRRGCLRSIVTKRSLPGKPMELLHVRARGGGSSPATDAAVRRTRSGIVYQFL